MIGTTIVCGNRSASFPVPFNRLMAVRSFDNRGHQMAGTWGIWHRLYLDDDYIGFTWVDQSCCEELPTVKPHWFAP